MLGAALAMTAVMAGAFGAHGLRSVLSPRGLEVFQTAVTYQMNHSLALILVALVSGVGIVRGRLLALAAGFFAAGIVLFSGSLYLLVLTEMSWLGPVTPMGGVCFIVGWALLIVAALKQPRQT
ncbi:DUF423 domain-containing protein [Marinobacter confluentis]|uniref:DUF423 domain-containing protein n=1 Tax=Marinobacter confluentis TaxID=1697557 RepID=A0A4Z1BHM4_9GAMM|nr:DUF423 domain-containing protein [Marinobacter confluentis]